MTYALESSKRKFERLLDSISNELSKKNDAPTKRPRLSDVSTTTRRPLSTFLHHESASSYTPAGQERKPAAYNPFDRKDFDRRLSTFRTNVAAWSPKSDDVSEVKWALRGWELAERNTVTCRRCSKRVLVDLEPDWPTSVESGVEAEDRGAETEASLVALYKDQIIEGHERGCPWRQRGCDVSMYRVHLSGFNNAVVGLKVRFESLNSLKGAMPKDVEPYSKEITEQMFHTFRRRLYHDPAASIHNDTERQVSSEAPQLDDSNIVAFVLALYGWARDFTNDSDRDIIVQCKTCFARAGLWMYERIDQDGRALTGGGLQSTFYADNLHYHDCPWINGETQTDNPYAESHTQRKSPAWEVLATFLQRLDPSLSVEIQNSSQDVAATSDRTARDVADKARFERVKALTKSINLKRIK